MNTCKTCKEYQSRCFTEPDDTCSSFEEQNPDTITDEGRAHAEAVQNE